MWCVMRCVKCSVTTLKLINTYIIVLLWIVDSNHYRPYLNLFNGEHISGHIRAVPAYNILGYDDHFIVPSHRDIALHVHLYDIPPGHIILAMCQPVFVLNYLL